MALIGAKLFSRDPNRKKSISQGSLPSLIRRASYSTANPDHSRQHRRLSRILCSRCTLITNSQYSAPAPPPVNVERRPDPGGGKSQLTSYRTTPAGWTSKTVYSGAINGAGAAAGGEGTPRRASHCASEQVATASQASWGPTWTVATELAQRIAQEAPFRSKDSNPKSPTEVGSQSVVSRLALEKMRRRRHRGQIEKNEGAFGNS